MTMTAARLAGSMITGDAGDLGSFNAKGVNIQAFSYYAERDQVDPSAYAKLDAARGVYLRVGSQDHQFYSETRLHDQLQIGQWDTVLDVGGCVGLYSIYAAKRGANVVCAEPEPTNAYIARGNFGAQKIGGRIAFIQAAIVPDATQTSEIMFYVNDKGVNKGIHSMMPRRGRSETRVPAVRWSEVIQNVYPTIIKVDIEGGEYALMQELANLPQRVRGIYCEMHFGRSDWRKEYAPRLFHGFGLQGFRTLVMPDVDPNSKRWDTCYLGVRP